MQRKPRKKKPGKKIQVNIRIDPTLLEKGMRPEELISTESLAKSILEVLGEGQKCPA